MRLLAAAIVLASFTLGASTIIAARTPARCPADQIYQDSYFDLESKETNWEAVKTNDCILWMRNGGK